MSKKLTKLSRARPKKDTTNKQLNNSDEDFQSVIVKPTNESKISQKEDSILKDSILKDTIEVNDTSTNASIATTTLPPCPFCGKKFNNAQELSRLSHLKACATQLGVDTNQLLEIRKLEDRQAEEWKSLNLPKLNNASKNSTARSNNSSLKVKRAEFLSTNDPSLEIALALSASLATTTVDNTNTVEEAKEVKINNSDTVNQCWLPQVRFYLLIVFILTLRVINFLHTLNSSLCLLTYNLLLFLLVTHKSFVT